VQILKAFWENAFAFGNYKTYGVNQTPLYALACLQCDSAMKIFLGPISFYLILQRPKKSKGG
jgi:hypothetical protein